MINLVQRSARVGWLHPQFEVWEALVAQNEQAMMAPDVNHHREP